MQGKGLATLLAFLVAVALTACGGGAEETTTAPSASGGEGPPAEVREGIRRRADAIRQERQQKKSGTEEGGAQKKKPATPVPPAPPVHHEDSGGGVAQFEEKGGDNSIQELGEEGSSSEREDAAAVLHAYLDARAAGRWEDACSYLSADTIAALEMIAQSLAGEKKLSGCPEIVRTLSENAPPAVLKEVAQADVGSLRIEGDHGFVLYHGARGLDYAFPVALEGGEWKLSTIEGTPLP